MRTSWPVSTACRAILTRDDGVTFDASSAFLVLPDRHAAARVTTNRATYASGETVEITGSVLNTSTNVDLANLTTLTQVFDMLGVERYRSESTLTSIAIGSRVQVPSRWVATIPGSYGVRFAVHSAEGELDSASTTIVVAGTTSLRGQLSARPALVPAGGSFAVDARAINAGTADAMGQRLMLRLFDASNATLVQSFERIVDLPANADVPWTVTMSASGLAFRRYTLVLQAVHAAGDETLASTNVEIVDATAPVVAITSPANEAFYNASVPLAALAADSGLGLDRVEYRIDLGPWTSMAVTDLPTGLFTATYPALPATEGRRTLSVRARDKAGNDELTSTTDPNPTSVVFTVDVTAPAIAFAGVTDGETYTSPVLPLVVVTDATATTVQITLNGSPFVIGTTISASGRTRST